MKSLQDITTRIGDGLHGTPKYDDSGDYYFINGNNLSQDKITLKKETRRVSKEEYLKHKKDLNERTLLVSINGTLGNFAFYNNEKVMLGKSACYLNLIDDVNKEYIGYLLKNRHFQRYIDSNATGTTIKNVSLQTIRSYEFELPSKKNQQDVSNFLSSFDRKIELNQKLNETLEEIAKTLFKSWFINFDPVRAKVEGRPTGLSKEISDLFPDSFVDSEVGEIPKGWKAGSLNDIIVRSKDKIKDTKSKVLAAVSSGELVMSEEYFSKQVFSKDTSKYLKVEQYDFAYNPSRINIGSIGMNEYDFIGAVSPVYIVFKPLKHWHLYINQFIKLKSTNSKINQLSSGSVRQSLSFDDFASIPIAKPTDLLNLMFNEIYTSLRRKIIQNQEECEILNSLRDTLLPRLISGELLISDAENLIKEAGV